MVQYDLFYNRKKRIGRDGKALIQIRCLLHRKCKFISTEVRVKPEHWDSKKEVVHKKHPKAGVLNKLINDKIESLSNFELEVMGTGKQFHLDIE